MLQLLVIGCGGAVGAVMRYGLSLRVTQLTGTGFPWGTLLVNLIGCFLLGLVVALTSFRLPVNDVVRNGIQVGLLGGFTTFSAFSMDALGLFDQGMWMRGLVYIGASVVFSLLGAYLGLGVGRQF